MTTFQTVLFDLDGTLIDSVDLIVDSYLHTFRAHQLPEIPREQIIAGIGTPLRSVFRGLGASDADITAWTATYRAFNLAHHDERVRAFPGAVEMVRQIAATGHRLGLVTSKNRQGAMRGLALVGLGDVMEVIVGADDVERPKPHPEPVERALASLGMPTAGAVFIGDSTHDIHSGQGAGVATIGVTWGPFSRRDLETAAPTHFCDSPAEVLAVLGL
jgi:pyrophosphatase PpaX